MADDETQDHAPLLLVVDNHATRRGLVATHLLDEGFRVETAEGGGGSALWLAQTYRPWVIVATHDMPGTDGIDVCRKLRGDPETHHIPLIVTVPEGPDEVTIDALEAGASVVLRNPVTPQLLLAHVYAQLNTFQVVMELREKNQYLRDLVVMDPMTGLFNHGHLHELVERELGRSRRTGSPVSLMLVDLDHFKDINDQHGHQAGDYCLKTCASLLSQGGRSSDAVARYGGDKFAIVLPETPKNGAAARGETLRQRVESRVFSDMGLPSQTISVGVATFPQDATDRASLFGAADRALYAAKGVGRNRVVAFSPELAPTSSKDADAAMMQQLLALTDVINDRLARFVYQPIVSAARGEVFAYEALCRPEHDAFAHAGVLFATGERAGRVAELGRALRSVAVEPLGELGGGTLVFVNLHPLEVNGGLVEEAREKLSHLSGRLVFEITESSEISDYGRLRTLISQLQESGFRVAVDDLGAGYAGLNSLALLKPDFVKLDMALVRGIDNDGSVARLIRHILDFTDEEGMLVVAEGVETEHEMQVVVELGCDLLQGYYFARPGPPFVAVEGEARDSLVACAKP